MECNKDEAIRAKEIAEKKFLAKDIAGAKKFALKAQSLYPGLDDISRMLATFDVYVSVENKVNGETDWYGVLGASPGDDDETLRKRYRKFALVLHPDKNKSIGAEGAFKHISEAWNFLSDKAKRAAYDLKRTAKPYYKFPTPSTGASFANPANNGVYQSAKPSFNIDRKTPKGSAHMAANPSARGPVNTQNAQHHATNGMSNSQRAGYSTYPVSGDSQRQCNMGAHGSSNAQRGWYSAHPGPSYTFWTVCRSCMMQYEYPKICMNRFLMCANCLQTFLAVLVPPPGSSSLWKSPLTKKNLNQKTATQSTTGSERTKAEDGLLKRTVEMMSSCSSSGGAEKRRRVMEDARIGSHGSKVVYRLANGTGGKLYGTKHSDFLTSEIGGRYSD